MTAHAHHTDYTNLIALIENTDDLIWSVDRQYRLIIGNSVFQRSIEALLGDPFEPDNSLLPEGLAPETLEQWRQRYDRALRGERFRVEMQGQLLNLTRHYEFSFNPITGTAGQITGVAVIGRDITQRKQAEAEISFQANLLNTVGQAIIATQVDGTIIYWNHAAEHLYGWREAKVLGQNIVDVTSTNTTRAQAQSIMEHLARGETWRGEFLVQRKDGTSFPAIISDTPILDDEGNLVGIIGITTDITQQTRLQEQTHAALREKEALLQEVYHRVKNNLQLVSSILEMHARTVATPAIAAALIENQARIQSIAAIHELLYQSHNLAYIDMAQYVARLVSHLRQLHPNAAVTLRQDIQPIALTLETAIPCALIINELVANAFQHAFPANTGGVIVLRMAARDDQVELTISNDGQPLPADFELGHHPTLGLRLVTILARQLEGTIDRVPDPTCTIFRLRFPYQPLNEESYHDLLTPPADC